MANADTGFAALRHIHFVFPRPKPFLAPALRPEQFLRQLLLCRSGRRIKRFRQVRSLLPPSRGRAQFLTFAVSTASSYVESDEAAELELTAFTDSTVTLSMDRDSNLSDQEARDSVRLSSKDLIQPNSLLVIDLQHVPTGYVCPARPEATMSDEFVRIRCFVFPSIYLHGANGSLHLNGEIDIFDGSSNRDFNRYSVRSPEGCALSPRVATSEANGSASPTCGVCHLLSSLFPDDA